MKDVLIKNNWHNFINRIVLMEQYCILCGCRSSSLYQICDICQLYIQQLSTANRPYCHKCSLYLVQNHWECQNCLNNQFYFDGMIACYEYAFPLTQILHKVKYGSNLGYCGALAELFCQQILQRTTNYMLPDAMTVIPLYYYKQISRGFNQVYEIIRSLLKKMNITFIDMQRTKPTQSQATLTRQQRELNIHNVFSLGSCRLYNKHIVIVDDVVTTASTVNAAAKLCKAQGAKTVDVWCLLRTQVDSLL